MNLCQFQNFAEHVAAIQSSRLMLCGGCVAEAVPKRILDLLNVDGLTRENVASHLQVSF